MEIDWGAYSAEYDLMCDNLKKYKNLILEIKKEISMLGLNPKSKVAEIGSGTGNFILKCISPVLAQEAEIYSIELSSCFMDRQALKISQSRLKNVSLVRGDATSLPFAKCSLDALLMVHVLNFLEEGQRDEVMRNVYNVLKGGGYFIISDIGRKINVVKESFSMAKDVFLEKGFKYLLDLYSSTSQARMQNMQAMKRQEKGISFLHNLEDFVAYVQSFGFECVRKNDNFYGGLDDFVVAVKK